MTPGDASSQKPPRRVLMVTQWFDPEPTFKGLDFARALKDRGYDVQVVTGFPNYPGGKIYPGYRVRLLQREVIDGVEVTRIPLYPSHDRSAFRRMWNYASFAITSSIACLGVRRPDVVYCYHPPATSVLGPRILRMFKRTPYVLDIQDLWPDSLAATGMLNRRGLTRVINWFVRGGYRDASRVVVLSDGFRDALAARGVPDHKLVVIPNWTYENLELEEFSRPPDDQFTVVYAGNIGSAQALDVVLYAAQLLKEDSVRFELIGDGVDLERIKELSSVLGLENVVFVPRRPQTEMPEVFAAADALLVHLKDDPLFAITVPGKTQAYLYAGRPILMGVKGEAAEIVTAAGAGISFQPESPDDLARAVRQLMSGSLLERRRMGEAGQKYYQHNMSLDTGVDRFAQVFDEVGKFRPPHVTKRWADVIVATLVLLVTAIPMGVVAIAIALTGGRPILFRQARTGWHGQEFTVVKFRTMRNARGTDGALVKDKDRLTRLGRFLRRTSLDELPQLWNVLKGEMSIVGPRPLLTRYTEYFTQEERARFLVRPGVTGLAQVNGRNLASWDARLALDVRYVREQSFRMDLKILLKTVILVFGSRGVVVDPESRMKNLDDERRKREDS